LPLLFACNGRVSPEFAPAPRQMSPGGGPPTRAFRVSVAGDFFLTATELAAKGGVSVDLGFTAFLDDKGLAQVTWISPHQLDVTVPAGLPIGPHALTVVAPSGLSGRLPAAWTTDMLSGALTFSQSPTQPRQTLVVTLTVTNHSADPAQGFSALTPTIAGRATFTLTGANAGPANIAPGGSASFSWTYNVTQDGTATFTTSGSGTDQVTGKPAPLPSLTSPVLTVQTPSFLSATMALANVAGTPTAVFAAGDLITLSLTVANSGQTAATAVKPGTLVISPTSSVQISSGPVPGPTTIAGGASQTYVWTLQATQSTGPVTFSAAASGADAISNAAVASSAANANATIVAPVQQLALPVFPGTQSTSFAYVFGYRNQIWLGPAGDGGGAISIAPDGTSPAQIGFQLRVDNASLFYQARNTAWTTSPPPNQMPPATTVGYSGCQQGTTACGPDNENGRGLFFSAVVNNTEWMGLTGARDTLGARFLYLTTPSIISPVGKLDFAYDNLLNGVHDTTLVATAAYAFSSTLWIGYLDWGNSGAAPVSGPVLHQLLNVPSALPGINANSGSGIDLVDLRADYMPYVGANAGATSNLTGSQAPPLMIDSLASFGPGSGQALYLANNGGWLRSTNGAPRPCTAPGACADWVAISPNVPGAGRPAAASYAAGCSLPSLKVRDLEPADKAVPYIVPFGGRLFLARNTYKGNPGCNNPTLVLGPQLWSCAPTGPNQQCNPGDWSLVAPNALPRDVNLTQMQDANNTAITLLAAAGGYLYVGFNNASSSPAGVQIYRTANPAAASQADFTGLNGCIAGGSGCAGIGGNGLGQGVTRIFDGRAISFAGGAAIYLTAGTGNAPLSLFRVNP
jgi:hypothetical protein